MNSLSSNSARLIGSLHWGCLLFTFLAFYPFTFTVATVA